jgi:hypothetical protein
MPYILYYTETNRNLHHPTKVQLVGLHQDDVWGGDVGAAADDVGVFTGGHDQIWGNFYLKPPYFLHIYVIVYIVSLEVDSQDMKWQ